MCHALEEAQQDFVLVFDIAGLNEIVGKNFECRGWIRRIHHIALAASGSLQALDIEHISCVQVPWHLYSRTRAVRRPSVSPVPQPLQGLRPPEHIAHRFAQDR